LDPKQAGFFEGNDLSEVHTCAGLRRARGDLKCKVRTALLSVAMKCKLRAGIG
jgi:hypothetical protein